MQINRQTMNSVIDIQLKYYVLQKIEVQNVNIASACTEGKSNYKFVAL